MLFFLLQFLLPGQRRPPVCATCGWVEQLLACLAWCLTFKIQRCRTHSAVIGASTDLFWWSTILWSIRRRPIDRPVEHAADQQTTELLATRALSW